MASKGRCARLGIPVLWINDVTGDYKVPMDPDVDIPLRYKMQGFVRKEYPSYFEHKQICKKLGLVNHRDEGVRNDDDLLQRGVDTDSIGKRYGS